MTNYNIIFFPSAGGSSYSYVEYVQELKKKGNVYLIDYAGHGKRFKEKPVKSFAELLDDVDKQLEKIPKENLILFGHSMGALVAAYTSMRLYEYHNICVHKLILSCCVSPNRVNKMKVKNTLDNELIDYLLYERNLSIKKIMSQEFQKYFWTVIKNDFDIIKEFNYFELFLPVCSLYCIYAKNDPVVNYNDILAWKNYTNSFYSLFKVEGGHFFFEEYPNVFSNLLDKIIEDVLF